MTEGMASQSVEKGPRYPTMQYPKGKAPFMKRSMHHNSTLASFGYMKECIGEYVYNDIRDNSQVRVHVGKNYGNKRKSDEDEANADDIVPLLMRSARRTRIDIGKFLPQRNDRRKS
ncbi:uncharacterized protein LOC111830563 [Capsella rubella]|uniref:uncharacterized protein LOC111830563 n=1 Tax=Capsella rubella TaxID=81985 RepID=UPI000CD4DDF8|nr:uncharacterized protein LOC111830563 [Capsella rubella]